MKVLDFFEWMEERETIRQARGVGRPAPWTTDPVLRTYSFTNVMREFDRVSVWIQQNITDPYAKNPNLWIMLAIARQINWPPALQQLLDAGTWPLYGLTPALIREMRAVLDAYQAEGNKVYTGAYMIHADSDARTSDIWINKNHYVLGQVIGQLAGARPPRTSMREFVHWMSRYESWGGFMSYEVACDLRWAPGWLDRAPDLRSWANPGPGAKRGLNRIHSRPLKSALNEMRAVDEMKMLLDAAERRSWKVRWPRAFELRDIEHSLCEFDKYLRAALGEGKPRAKYNPTTEY